MLAVCSILYLNFGGLIVFFESFLGLLFHSFLCFYFTRNAQKNTEFLFFRFAQEITITQYNKSKLFSTSFNSNFPTDITDNMDFCLGIL